MVLIVVLLLLVLSIPALAQEGTEITFADPTIVVENGRYYLTGTRADNQGSTPGFAILESADLMTWNTPQQQADEAACLILAKGQQTYGTDGFWAPQLFIANGRYYLTYTANEQTVLAQSDVLLGPYKQSDIGPIDGREKNIDSYVFKDDDGKYYLYHVRFGHGNYLWVAEFDLDTGTINPETLTKCFDPTEPWETSPAYPSDPIMEGPTVIKLRDKYYLFYSANHFMNVDYAVGYAVADSPYGPWEKPHDNPIIHRSILGENGSGHGDIFEGLDGQWYYVYHVHASQRQVMPRRTRIVPIDKEWDDVAGHYTFRVDSSRVIVPIIP